ncbi:MAG TPA: nucleoside-triphosphatase [Methanospirillum sp.]|uniref:nucleoside-triphosphatase n=1 Tax=Methanospirillum sp. TaxID=45200 RepID=UPI002C9B55DA|nr:nucleoside-triphosphatase [Methanospirillum sp.]HWQ64631.1 nucleoside-triphosphatase [Methanospirillum sp.]
MYIITGAQAEGKTTFLMQILDLLRAEGVKMQGFVAPGYFQDGMRSGFSITNLETGASEELCSTTPEEGAEQHARYYFRPKAITFGNRALLDIRSDTTDLLVIDEVGRFDVQGSLWGGSITWLVEHHHPPMIWTVRRDFLGIVTERWQIKPVIRDIGSVSFSEVAEEILGDIRIYRSAAKQLD